jgi:predicted nucleotide-binding protein
MTQQTKGAVELPSDYDGVLYIPMDEHDGWKSKLAREIKAAGLEITGDVFY